MAVKSGATNVFGLVLAVEPLDATVAAGAECRSTAGRPGPARLWGWPTFGGDGANYGQTGSGVMSGPGSDLKVFSKIRFERAK